MAPDRPTARASDASEDSRRTAPPVYPFMHAHLNLPPLDELLAARAGIPDYELTKMAETALLCAREALRILNVIHDEQRARRAPRAP